MNKSNQPESRGEISANELVPEADKEPGTQPQGRREVGGPLGPEPTRYGDWEKAGRCIGF